MRLTVHLFGLQPFPTRRPLNGLRMTSRTISGVCKSARLSRSHIAVYTYSATYVSSCLYLTLFVILSTHFVMVISSHANCGPSSFPSLPPPIPHFWTPATSLSLSLSLSPPLSLSLSPSLPLSLSLSLPLSLSLSPSLPLSLSLSLSLSPSLLPQALLTSTQSDHRAT